MHGPRDPSFAFYRDQIDYVARNNYVLQQGVAKLDIAIWKKAMIYPGHIQVRNYGPTDLEESGKILQPRFVSARSPDSLIRIHVRVH